MFGEDFSSLQLHYYYFFQIISVIIGNYILISDSFLNNPLH